MYVHNLNSGPARPSTINYRWTVRKKIRARTHTVHDAAAARVHMYAKHYIHQQESSNKNKDHIAR